MELAGDLPRAIESSNRALSKGIGPPTLLSICLLSLRASSCLPVLPLWEPLVRGAL